VSDTNLGRNENNYSFPNLSVVLPCKFRYSYWSQVTTSSFHISSYSFSLNNLALDATQRHLVRWPLNKHKQSFAQLAWTAWEKRCIVSTRETRGTDRVPNGYPPNIGKGKKVKFSPEEATKAQRGSRGIALLFL